ncbi:glycosyltransferase [Pseudoflavitalea rhizosphaerae]|uniref:glycosyltransferase n=1 Tax=Pseudoflavitalea rhizosphaerae TaxID=1884793 RepID=UPI000F8D2DB1|nr:glycosyltransferase [Pseudoflavitalea rhizosphaerae]
MITSSHQSRILFISTFPPSKCGIASFTEDLLNAITPAINNDFVINICALGNQELSNNFKYPVTMVMDAHQLASCIDTAQLINNDSSIELVSVEHEFGLFGGELGEYLLGFLSMLEKPFIIRFHTVLPDPDSKRLQVVRAIAMLAEKIIVMTGNSSRLLTEDYQIDSDKITIIPHGTHARTGLSEAELKIANDLENKLVLTTFGLLSPNKGIEKGILAMKDICARIPEAIYIVIGQTHPNLLLQEGEEYRNYLQQIIDDNNLQQNIRLINEYVPTKKLMEYLALTDIYLFTSKDPDQAVSGTFLYAMSAGCAIISNAFILAKEMLDEKTGIILQTNEVNELAEYAIGLLQNKNARTQMGIRAFIKTRNSNWKNVAEKHIELFNKTLARPIKPAKTFTILSVNQ